MCSKRRRLFRGLEPSRCQSSLGNSKVRACLWEVVPAKNVRGECLRWGIKIISAGNVGRKGWRYETRGLVKSLKKAKS